MLTGRLPYTVEPFNISTLYNKMLKRQMNAIPEYLSEACKDMTHQLLNPDPKERLHILEAVRHRWITMDQRDPLGLIPCPNYLCEEDLDDRILDHVEEQLKLNSDDVIRDVIQNKATKNSCVYHLLVRRLERYEREQTKLINTPPPTIQLTESKPPSSPEHKQPSPNHHTQKNGLVKYSSPKTHIMENPFKTIKVALIRQKKAMKNEEKSKGGKSSSHDSTPHSTTNPEAKPKLCTVKRVALVKFSPARRSLRGLTSGPRNSTNSPKPGRRRNYFEGLQRRKSPKVRRRHAEPDESLSSAVSTSRRTSIDNTDNVGPIIQRMRIEDKINNNSAVENSKTLVDTSEVVNSDTKSEKCTCDALLLGNIPENGTLIRNEDPGTNTSGTVTHLYTNKGVVLKRDSLGENHKTTYEQEQATVQHHVFHGGDKTGGGVKDEQGCRRVNGVNSKQGTAGSGLSKIEVMNAKISSVSSKVAETAKPTSQRLSTSSTAASRQTTRTQSLKAKATPSKQTAQKAVIPRRTLYKPDNSSKIPVVAGKSSVLSRQSPMSPTRLAPRTLTSSNTRLPATRKNDVARLADKYDKCVSVIVVDRSTDAGKGSSPEEKSSTTAGKGSANSRNNIKGIAPNVEKISAVDDSKNRNGLSEKIERAVVSKASNATVKEQTSKESVLGANQKSRGNDTKQKAVEAKEIKEKTDQNVEQLRNGLQRQKVKDQANTKTSMLKLAKESLTACRTTSKDTKQAVENARKNSINNRTSKVSTVGNSRRSSVKSQETEDTKSWTGDERRKISNYKKTNESQQTTSAVKREAKTATSVRTSAFKTSS
ncbi:serine threonine- kinase MARK2-like isoform X1 [Paramuricea clavata]|nr:serine threonine- kinase MARK2-like isoform X1 [Paramuricea clavata]